MPSPAKVKADLAHKYPFSFNPLAAKYYEGSFLIITVSLGILSLALLI